MISRSKKGFTLIELLVVISVIGLLSSVVISFVNSARIKAKDSHRLVEVREVEKALALYYDKYGSYPISTGPERNWANDCDPGVIFVIPELVTEKLFTGVKDLKPCPSHWGFSYASNGKDYKFLMHSEEFDLNLNNLIDPATDGGPNKCIVDGINIEHYGVWTDGAKCWEEAKNIPGN